MTNLTATINPSNATVISNSTLIVQDVSDTIITQVLAEDSTASLTTGTSLYSVKIVYPDFGSMTILSSFALCPGIDSAEIGGILAAAITEHKLMSLITYLSDTASARKVQFFVVTDKTP